MKRAHRPEIAGLSVARVASLMGPVGVLALGACAQAPTAADSVQATASRFEDGRASDCLFASTLRDWRPLDDQNLILFATGRRPYHVELASPAFGLSSDVVIGVYDRDGRICPFGGDSIVIDDVVTDRITIRSVRELTDEQLTEAYVAFGVEPPAIIEAIEIEEDIDSVR